MWQYTDTAGLEQPYFKGHNTPQKKPPLYEIGSYMEMDIAYSIKDKRVAWYEILG